MIEIKLKILQFSQKNKRFRTKDVHVFFKGTYSRTYISIVLSSLVNENQLVREGAGPQIFYSLPGSNNIYSTLWSKKLIAQGLNEDTVWFKAKEQSIFLQKLPENIDSILSYAFVEMLNNAIEHAESKYIEASIEQSELNIKFIIRDFGVGVFRNFKIKRHLKSETEAIQDLLKGKNTTQPELHTGQGIFFTSKVADIFILKSYEYTLRIDNTIPDIFVKDNKKPIKGTEVTFQIEKNSKKHLIKVFEKYQTNPEDYDFNKTEVKVRLYTMGTIYISRSQARRVLATLDKFKHIILDFEKVPTIGQAFADEVFRVFANRYPTITIEAINMEKGTEFMAKRVEYPKNVLMR